MPATSRIPVRIVLALVLGTFLLAAPSPAFTANSLQITVDTSGDATAVFSYTLEGIVENSIPESMLEEELKKGLTTSSDPPEVVSFDRSGATLLMKNFAQTSDTETGTEYMTASMDFSKAEIALKNSALSYVISADFTPATTTVKFPDGFTKTFSDQSTLPSITHTVVDPLKKGAAPAAAAGGTLRVTSSPSPAKVSLDSAYIGDTPGVFNGISPGEHTVLVERDGYIPATRTVIIEAGRNTTVPVGLEELPLTTEPQASPGLSALLCCLAAAAVIVLYRKCR